MSILASLNKAYSRMADRGEVAPFGYSSEKIGFIISLDEDGKPAVAPIDRREGSGKKMVAPLLKVPQPAKRTSGIAPNFLWDKSAYVLGVTTGEGKRTSDEHEAFRSRHLKELETVDDAGLLAFRRFVEWWAPDQFETLGWPAELKDQNIVFALEADRHSGMIHDRPAARDLWTRISAGGEGTEATCLVSGERLPLARLHPAIKGVWGAQSSGGSIVSFNKDAFASYGHEQGDNAPVSEAAAFAYTTALNRFLEKDSGHRIQIGDASTVFWADASDAEAAEEAESVFMASLGGIDENVQSDKIRTVLDKIHAGRPFAEIEPDLPDGVRFYVLGLAPNAARLSVRFWIEDDFGEIAKRFIAHFEAMRIEPPPKELNPSMWRCLIETAVLRKSENIPPKLAGDWLRAILTGKPYPQTLLATLLMRLRADKDVNGLRVAMLKAVLVKRSKEVPMSLDPDLDDPGYLLGRLFAIFEYVQTQALGGKVNATIRDQYYGTASATPRAVFPALLRKATHHLSRLRKDKAGWAVILDRKIGEIFERAEPEKLFVPTLTMQRQALFAVGYYHQRNDLYRAKDTPAAVQPQE